MKIYNYMPESIGRLVSKLKERNSEEQKNITEAVQSIISEVRQKGDEALFELTKKFDGVTLQNPEVKKELIENSFESIEPALARAIKRAAGNIRSFHENQKEKSWFTTEENGILLGQKVTPLERVGIYVPGGTAPLPSSVLMNAIPAKIAGVKEIIMLTPPGKNGVPNPAILACALIAGVDRVFQVGGAQAIAAMAYGTETIPKVDKITGPGNIFVATAKKMVYGLCDIDMIAGPSEVMIIADDSAKPEYVAADLLSQAEHDILASAILITTSQKLLEMVLAGIEKQTEKLPRKELIQKSLDNNGAMVLVNSIDEAVELANKIAPEHLELCVRNPFLLVGDVKNAGAIFLGEYSPEPLGDYMAGPNHVLPTNGTARFYSPLSVDDFVKRSSIISYSKEALENVWQDIATFAEAEGLTAHANSVRIRFKDSR
ncbi:MAG: histidinol dehydrogenase [Ruminiclostridium sp.]|nr:histidinol dehydrogenase [Ruminiclostridium sp.]